MLRPQLIGKKPTCPTTFPSHRVRGYHHATAPRATRKQGASQGSSPHRAWEAAARHRRGGRGPMVSVRIDVPSSPRLQVAALRPAGLRTGTASAESIIVIRPANRGPARSFRSSAARPPPSNAMPTRVAARQPPRMSTTMRVN